MNRLAVESFCKNTFVFLGEKVQYYFRQASKYFQHPLKVQKAKIHIFCPKNSYSKKKKNQKKKTDDVRVVLKQKQNLKV